MTEQDPAPMITTPIRLEYDYTPGQAATRFLRHVAEGRYVGQRCPKCTKVYVPPRGSCPTCGVPTDEEVELAQTGTITAFCIVNIPFAGQAVECPYVSATIQLDGADIGFYHLIQEIPYDQIHIGMRVEAVWKDRAEWGPTTESIKYFRPISSGGGHAPHGSSASLHGPPNPPESSRAPHGSSASLHGPPNPPESSRA